MNPQKLALTMAALASIAPFALHADAPPAPANPAVVGAAPVLPHQLLTIVKNEGTNTDTPGLAVHDFGTLSLQETAPIQHDFSLRNDSGGPVTLDHVQAACSCTAAVADGVQPGEDIAAGKTITIHVSVDPGHLGPGPANKMVWVYLKGQPAPAATLQMMGTMKPVVTFFPSLLDFGKVSAGTEKSLLLTVTGDEKVLETLPAPILNPPVEGITLVRAKEIRKGTDGQSSLDYHVVLGKNVRIGQLQNLINFMVGTNPDYRLASAYASMVGEVTGEVSATPSTVAFGSVAGGKSATQQIIVAGDEKVLKKSSVRSASPFVTAKLVFAPKGGQTAAAVADMGADGKMGRPAQATLSVVLNDNAPSGVLQTEVTLTTPSGQRLALPVWAFIEGAHAPAP